MFYNNEMNFSIKECGSNICSWDKFYNMFKDTIDPETCNTDYCSEMDQSFLEWLQNEINKNEKTIKDQEQNLTGSSSTTGKDNSNNDDNTISLQTSIKAQNDTVLGEYTNNTNVRSDIEKHHGVRNDSTQSNKLDVLVGTSAMMNKIDELPISQKEKRNVHSDKTQRLREISLLSVNDGVTFGLLSNWMTDFKSNKILSRENLAELNVFYTTITILTLIILVILIKRLFCRRKYILFAS